MTMGTRTVGDVLDIEPSKWRRNKIAADPPPGEAARMVYTCKCGSQVFFLYAEGLLRCIACDRDHSTFDVFKTLGPR
jgi:hypothetical protein